MEEIFEIWAWRQLGYHHKPLGKVCINRANVCLALA
ncbi:MAG: hypothetical protein WAQ08_21425 [Aquabacterium sp.]|jgi:predicted Rossmann-fold nucleotide-binding protein